jgi:hypothetical protein
MQSCLRGSATFPPGGITKFSNITEKIRRPFGSLNQQKIYFLPIRPFFDKYKIIGVKFQDYQDFKKVAPALPELPLAQAYTFIDGVREGSPARATALRRILMEKKAHLTSEGLDKICLIKAGMNRGRVEFSQSDLGRRRRLPFGPRPPPVVAEGGRRPRKNIYIYIFFPVRVAALRIN